MKPFDQMSFHPLSEQIVSAIRKKTGINNTQFYRIVVASHLSNMASSMNVKLRLSPKETQAINFFGIALSASGTGKDYSMKIMEENVTNQFVERFLEETFPTHAEDNLPKLAVKRAARKASDPDTELDLVSTEYRRLGPPVYAFDGATIAAVRQFRHKLLMANLGALNMQVNEIGANLLSKQDELKAFIELYDGKIKTSLTKNTQDNARNEEIIGNVPTNMLLFGTPAMLLQTGSKLEENFHQFLETGYARRCFFAYYTGKGDQTQAKLTPEEELKQRFDTNTDTFLEDISEHFANLADLMYAHSEIIVPEAVLLESIRYKQSCEERASDFREHQIVLQQEMKNRHYKMLKLAGAYAFVDGSPEVTLDHLENAIKLAEESGKCFRNITIQEKPYEKLARYIASVGDDLTHADLDAALPFYPKVAGQRSDMLQMATAFGYRNNIIIKKAFNDGIEFLRGETLQKTILEKMVVAYSTDIATGYRNEHAPWDELHKLTQAQGMHWINHHVHGGHRQEDNIIPGCNMLVFDVDGTVPLHTAKMLLEGYKALFYTTKRHQQDGQDRFRIILPTNFNLNLDAKDFKEFYRNVMDWLPFEVDEACGQRARKWLAHSFHHEYTDGELFDVLPFIPKTSKNDERKKVLETQQHHDNLERWVLNNSGDGNRNNMLLRYAMILVDAGFHETEIRHRVMDLNAKMPDKLDEVEILSTIMVSVTKAVAKRP